MAALLYYYNWHRPHTSLNGKTPMERLVERLPETPYSWEVAEQYEPAKEPLRERYSSLNLRLRQLKRSE